MINFSPRYLSRTLISVILAVGALTFCPLTMATEAVTPEDHPATNNILPGPLGVGVSGASAGITTEYFEAAAIEALVASSTFSSIDGSKSADIPMRMRTAKGVFPGTAKMGDTPYFLSIRVSKVDAPSFSFRMTVSMDVVWVLHSTAENAEKAELWREKIHSEYTGGMLEGGVHGANRVIAAMEGASRENIRIGIEMLEALDIEQLTEMLVSEQE
jgi:hypothetical protein